MPALLLAQSSAPSLKLPLLRHCNRSDRKLRRPTLAKKLSTSEKKEGAFTFRLSKALVYKSAIAISGLGFLDAGYSGDWSRIGVISTETEEFLKVAAYFVVPFCIFLVSIIFDEDKT